MNGSTQQVRKPGGVTEQLPQPIDGASEIVNYTVDKTTKCWSTRIGYEKYRPRPEIFWQPFNSTKRIDSLFVFNQLANGARYHILFESNGNLYLFYEAIGSTPVLRVLASGRNISTPTEACSQYTIVGDAVLVTNGHQAPILVRPWPLGDSTASGQAIERCVRDLGWTGLPTSPDLLTVVASTGVTTTAHRCGGDSLALWWPSNPFSMATGFGSLGGIGFSQPDADGNNTSEFQYKVSFISDTGSESPLSPPAGISWQNEGTVGYRYAVGMRVPTGPKGTVARRIYRTNNYGKGLATTDDYTSYFAFDIRNSVEDLAYDAYRPASLGAIAPSVGDSIPLPCPEARFGAMFADCLWLDGGFNDAYTLYYSAAGRPDQFAASSYIHLSGDNGGITALFAWYNVLLVFRERGIDVVRGNANAGFTVTTLSTQVSCKSPNTIDTVPDVGVVFLAVDGIYALSGGFEGGAVARLVKLTESLESTMTRATQDTLARAVGRYSALTNEYHCYFAADGQDRPSIGVVWHVDKKGWSLRTGFPVGALDKLPTEELLFGHHTGTETSNTAEAGLFVISSKRNMGGVQSGEFYVTNPPPTSKWKSPWLDFGDAQVQKQPQYVTLWVMTTGSVSLTLTHYKDFGRTGVTETSYLAQPPDAALLPVYDTAIIGTDVWETSRLVPIRIAVASQSCAWFAFEFSTTNDLIFVGWEVEFVTRGTRVIAGKKV